MRFFILSVVLTLSANVYAGARISTYLEGKVVVKTLEHWVVETKDGTYWIKLTRPLSWVRKTTNARISFWVAIDQISRFRPASQLLMCEPDYSSKAHDGSC